MKGTVSTLCPKGPMVTLPMSNKQSREKEPEPLGSLPQDAKPVCCALQRQDEKGRHQPCRWPFRDRGRAEHAQRRHCRGWRRFCPESQAQSVCPQKRLHKLPCLPRHPLLRALSHLCSLFQSGRKAPSLPSTIHNTSVNTQAIIPPSF